MAHKAHKFGSKPRTDDVRIQEDVNFRAMLLPDSILEGLYSCGFRRPSPIQLRAIPLARCGIDLIVHAKSGTGKTCVFTVTALDMVQTESKLLQVLVLAPTREICLQVKDVITGIGCKIPGLKVECFIGGRPFGEDVESLQKGCHIAVGTIGRVKHLIDKDYMKTEHVRLLVLDEFDKLMEEEHHDEINSIYANLPDSKQILVCSATYTEAMMNFVKLYMTSGTHVTPDGHPSAVLLGIRQFVSIVPHHVNKLARTQNKEKQLLRLLSTVSFDQCFIFTNYQTRAESLCKMLCGKGWSADWIAGMQAQSARIEAMQNMRDQKIRVLVTTDITARGIDAYSVNLIINLEIPYDHTTYLHRMGRAGRFGSYGMVITILTDGEEVDSFRRLLGRIGGCQMSANIIPTRKTDTDLWKDDLSQFEKIFGIEEEVTENEPKEFEKNESSSSEEKSKENSATKCTFPCHIKCSDICSESNNNCLFVTSKFCSFIEDRNEIIYYDRIPLNVPLAVVGEKLIRLNKLPFDSQILHSGDINESIRFLSNALFTKEEKTFILKDFSKIEKSYNDFLTDEDVSTYSQNINITAKFKPHEELADAVEDILLSVIQKDEQLKNICKLVNSFDLLMWTAIDKSANIIKDIQNTSVSIIEFKTEKCTSLDTENHIRVVNYRNLKKFMQSLSLAEIGELTSSVSKKLCLLSVKNIYCDGIRLNNIIDASKYLMNLDMTTERIVTPPTIAFKEVSDSNEKAHNTSQKTEDLAENVNLPSSISEEAVSENQEKIHNTSKYFEEVMENVRSPTSGFKKDLSSENEEEVNNSLPLSWEPVDHDVKSPATVIQDEEAVEKQQKILNISHSSEEPAEENSGDNKIRDENDVVGKQDSSVDEKSSKKIKRKDGFGRNAKHISEMYPNADIEEEKSFPNVNNTSSSSEVKDSVPEKKIEYKRKIKRRRPLPRPDNKHGQFRKDRKDSNDNKINVERNNVSELNVIRREFSEITMDKVEKVNPSSNNSKIKNDTMKEEQNLNKSYPVEVNFMKNNHGDACEDNILELSLDSESDLEVYERKYIQQNLKRNKETTSVSGESSETRFSIKKRSDTRKATKRAAKGGSSAKLSDRYCYQPQQNFQNQFQNPSVYLSSHQQWTSGMYTNQQWSKAYTRWYNMWYAQMRTISQYVEYSNYVSNMLQRK